MDAALRKVLEQAGYVVQREIGRGGMGAVYLARQQGLNRDVAVKCLLPEFAQDEKSYRRFAAECRVFRSLAHPNVIRVFDVGLDGPLPYLVLEFVPARARSTT